MPTRTVLNKKERGVTYKKSYIFCWWLWFAALLYYFNIIKYSPALPLIIALLFTLIMYVLNPEYHPSVFTIIFLIESFVLSVTLQKNKQLKRKLFNKNDMIISICLFAIYLLYLKYMNTSFQKVYFKVLPDEFKNVTFYNYFIKPFIKY